jgi:capsule biosynthesis phosphatase
MIYCVDLDDTLCFPIKDGKTTYEKYGNALPNKIMIDYINTKFFQNDKIIIHTARRMLTHNGDVQKIIEDVGEITENWLKEHNVQYTELVFGKPYADFYIDDKAVCATDLETYLKTKKEIDAN